MDFIKKNGNKSSKLFYELFMKDINNYNVSGINKIIEYLNGKMDNRIEYCLNILKRVKKYDIDVCTYTNVINSCTKSLNGSGRIAINLLEEMIYKGIYPNNITYGCCINVQSEKGSCKIAMKIFNLMIYNNIIPQKQQLNALIKCHSKCNDGSAAKVWKILDLFTKYKIIPDIKTIHLILETIKYKNDGSAIKSLDIFNILDKYNIKPDKIMFTTLLDCQSKCIDGNGENSYYILNKIFNYEQNPNAFHINTALNSCSLIKKVNKNIILKILDITNKIHFKPSNYTLVALFKCCKNMNDKEFAIELFNKYGKEIKINMYTKKYVDCIFTKEEYELLLNNSYEKETSKTTQVNKSIFKPITKIKKQVNNYGNKSVCKFTPLYIKKNNEHFENEEIQNEIILIKPKTKPKRKNVYKNYIRLPLGPSNINFNNINGKRVLLYY